MTASEAKFSDGISSSPSRWRLSSSRTNPYISPSVLFKKSIGSPYLHSAHLPSCLEALLLPNRPLDYLRRLADVVFRVEKLFKLVFLYALCYLLSPEQYLKQRLFLPVRVHAARAHQFVRFLPSHSFFRKRYHYPLSHHRTVREAQVPLHVFREELQAGEYLVRFLEHVVGYYEAFRYRQPLVCRIRQVALVLKGYVLKRHGHVRPDFPCKRANPLRLVRVPLLRHRS